MITRRDTMLGTAALGMLGAVDATAIAAPHRALSNPYANRAAQRLYRYLWSRYGNATLTGQQERGNGPEGGDELAYIARVTGRQPAILGLDYISPAEQDAVNDRATAWHRSGGIVALCWHWGAPDIGTGYENSKKAFDLVAALRPGTPQNALLLRDLTHIAQLLAILRDRGVPVLWRPLHEFSGDWFWWGKHGPEPFKALWRLMYDLFTHTHRLDNLVWVLGWAGQNVDPAWYPGRSRVDIAGADLYVADHGNLAPLFGQVKAIVGDTLPICLHENGPIPNPTLLDPAARWLWFMTWHTRWLMAPDQNDVASLSAAYHAPRYITKDALPRV